MSADDARRRAVQARLGLEHGAEVTGPPWILGARGSPLEAPENTLTSLLRAIEVGLDGVAYPVRRCASGDPVLLHDATLERTTDAHGPIAGVGLVELAEVDAGGWFHARFRGEPVPTLEQVLGLVGAHAGGRHLVHVVEADLVPDVVDVIRELGAERRVRVAARSRSAVLEARDAGLEALWVVDEVTEDVRRFARDERPSGVAAPARAWWSEPARETWSTERWALAADDPEELLELCRRPLDGFETREPARALAIRALVQLAPDDAGPYPLQVPELTVEPGALGEGGEWSGRWEAAARVRNPFGFPVRATAGIVVRRGAFEVGRVPVTLDLAPSEEVVVPFALTGGSWSPGGDPCFFVRFQWSEGSAHAAGALLLDAPLVRRREVVADAVARRLPMLREGPSDPPASMTVRRHGRHLLVAIENDAGVRDARTLVHLDGRWFEGGRGVRAPLPTDFDGRRPGIPFSCGFRGASATATDPRVVVRRWAGGVPDDLDSGSPGHLIPLGSA